MLIQPRRARYTTVQRKKSKLPIILILIVVILLIRTFYILRSNAEEKKEDNLIESNLVVLQNLEKVDVKEISKEINAKKALYTLDDSKPISHKISNKVYFQDSIFIGDSLTEGLSFYDMLNKSSVLAKKGLNVMKAKQEITTLAQSTPDRVFILYGVNDLLLFRNTEDFKKHYLELVDDIKNMLPDAQIYVQSMTPISSEAQKKRTMFSQDRIDRFTEIIQEVVQEKDVNYIDIRPIVQNNPNLFAPDGIHFQAKFYTYWLDYIRNQLKNN